MIFYLGTHEPTWLYRMDIPLFISRRRLGRLGSRWKPASCDWALDSGGFTELKDHGSWQTSASTYVSEARRASDEIGRLRWSAIQDWMCEPFMLALTGLSIPEHQVRTIASYHELRALAPDMPWMPVLQGWHAEDYLAHVEDYRASGVDLAALPVVGVGSVCRRQATGEATRIVSLLSRLGLRLHAFGFKIEGLARSSAFLESADSMAWSARARRGPPLPGCTHRACSNCRRYAMSWRGKVLSRLGRPCQSVLF